MARPPGILADSAANFLFFFFPRPLLVYITLFLQLVAAPRTPIGTSYEHRRASLERPPHFHPRLMPRLLAAPAI